MFLSDVSCLLAILYMPQPIRSGTAPTAPVQFWQGDKKKEPTFMKISILCCVYNNAQWLRACLDSIINQTFTDIEILIGDDGSTDPKAIEIMNEYAARDGRIVIDRHRNLGCGASLNRLLDMASGDYIAEIDGDDAYEPTAMETLYALTDGYVDMVKGSYRQIFPDGVCAPYNVWEDQLTKMGIFIPADLGERQLLKYIASNPSMWCGLYRRKWLIAEGIRWLETPGALYQDTSFALKTKMLAKTVRVTNDYVYLYNRCNEDSATRKPGNFPALANEYKAVERVMKERYLPYWPMLARLKYSTYMWMLTIVEDKREMLTLMQADMNGDIIRPDFFDEDELGLLEMLYGKRVHEKY